MGGKYKTKGKCGGSRLKGLDGLESGLGTHERSRYAKKWIHLFVFPREIPGGQGHGENMDDSCLWHLEF